MMLSIVSVLLLLCSCSAFTVQTPVTGFATQVRQPTCLSESASDGDSDDAKVVLVTGSARGLGKAIALEIGKARQKVVINYVSDSSKESADEIVKEIEELGGQALAIQADSE
mmetsp:Transcript_9935/g.20540  ORF Transcript_9935/g.20540 Transcript_9935/m.20540 type:complete len:112 (+) Transcript_9935:134-469(+)